MINSLDHHQFDLVISRGPLRNGVACHFLDDRPICHQVLLRLYLCWELGLQYAAPPSVPIGYLKTNGLRPLVDFLFSGLDNFLHKSDPSDVVSWLMVWQGIGCKSNCCGSIPTDRPRVMHDPCPPAVSVCEPRLFA